MQAIRMLHRGPAEILLPRDHTGLMVTRLLTEEPVVPVAMAADVLPSSGVQKAQPAAGFMATARDVTARAAGKRLSTAAQAEP